MLGSANIRLTAEERSRLQDLQEDVVRERKYCQDILEQKLRDLDMSPEDCIDLAFGLDSFDQEKLTDAAILEDYHNLLARFAVAAQLIAESAANIHAYRLRDDSLLLRRWLEEAASAINKMLSNHQVEPPKTPSFPNLGERLNEETEDFLKDYSEAVGDTTDRPTQTLMYCVRNYIILTELKQMQLQFKTDIAHL